jgi:5,10-methylenetetrahydromethanopterin reductase
VKAHVARVVAHPLPFVLDEKEKKVLEDIRRAYNYYQHMEQQASQAQVIPDWLVDKFAIAGTAKECRAQVERLSSSGINQIAIIPYGIGDGDREDTLNRFAAAVF